MTAVRRPAISSFRSPPSFPEQRRLEIENLNSPQFRGYTRTGTECTAGSADRREQIDIGPWRAAVDTGPDDPDYLRLVGPEPMAVRTAGVAGDRAALAGRGPTGEPGVLRAPAAALGQGEEYFGRLRAAAG
ncbi:hypothetical protein [Streptomyces sp. NPDC002962]|uniref:hypothetical protein n=1 Tax=Streptomyces sp. NPDC002962 TaxID=3364674 RepID=UPI0036C08669